MKVKRKKLRKKGVLREKAKKQFTFHPRESEIEARLGFAG